MCGKQLINIWLAFRILGIEMNFDNFIGVTCILCWHIGNFKFAFTCKMVEQALTTARLCQQNSLVTAHSFRPTYAVAK